MCPETTMSWGCFECTLQPLCCYSSGPRARVVFTEINPVQEELLHTLYASHGGSPPLPVSLVFSNTDSFARVNITSWSPIEA